MGVRDTYVLLDSWLKDEGRSDPSKGVYSFHLRPEGSADGEAGIATASYLKDAFEVSVDPFLIPLPRVVSDGGAAHDEATKAAARSEAFAALTAASADAGTTAALPASTYDNGVSGVGATLTADAVGALPAQDGVSLSVGGRLLVKDQANAVENGVYSVTDLGSGASAWVLTRATDADTSAEITVRAFTISGGSTLSGNRYMVPTNVVAFGTDTVDFALAYSVAAYSDPVVSSATTLTHPFSHVPLGGHVRMYVQEIPRQSFLSSRESNHHIEMSAEIVDGAEITGTGEKQQRLRLTPLGTTGGRFIMSYPVRELSTLTIRLFGGSLPLPLPLDRFDAEMDLVGGGARLSWPQSAIDDLADRAAADGGGKYFPVQKGDRIFITGVDVRNAATGVALSDLNAHINRPKGHLVGDLTARGGGNYYFGLFPEITGLPTALLGFHNAATGSNTGGTTVADVRVEKALLRIPMRFRSLSSAPTNSIVPT